MAKDKIVTVDDGQNLQIVGLRTLAGYPSRAAVAFAAGLSEPTCWRIESGRAAVRAESLAAYAREIGMKPEDLEMLRQSSPHMEARVVVLPPAAWEWLGEQASRSGESTHAFINGLVTMAAS